VIVGRSSKDGIRKKKMHFAQGTSDGKCILPKSKRDYNDGTCSQKGFTHKLTGHPNCWFAMVCNDAGLLWRAHPVRSTPQQQQSETQQ